MKYKDNNIQEKPIIVIEDCDSDSSVHKNLEEPVITIETDDASGNDVSEKTVAVKRSKGNTWLGYAVAAVVMVAVLIGSYSAVRLYNYYL